MIHRTRQGSAPLESPKPGRNVIQLGDVFVEYSGPAPSQADLDANFAPPDPADTPLQWDDAERLFLQLGATPAQIAAAKRNRG